MTARFDSPKFINTDYSEIIAKPKDCFVILPFSSFTERLDKNCWEKVVSILVKKGYKCYTNIQNKSWDFKRHGHIKRNEIKQEYEPVSGTIPLDCSIKGPLFYCQCWCKSYCGSGRFGNNIGFHLK